MNKKHLITTIFFLSLPFLASAWTTAPATPPGSNSNAPLDVSATAQSKTGGLIVNTGGATYGLLVPSGSVGIGSLNPTGLFDVWNGASKLFTVMSNGNVGIGVATPTSQLSVAGGVQVGTDAAACSAGKAGTVRWNAGALEVCNGTSWGSASASGTGGIGTVAGFGIQAWGFSGCWGCTGPWFSTCSNIYAPAWCTNGNFGNGNPSNSQTRGCATGYDLVNNTTSGYCPFGACDTNIWACKRNATPLAASCTATAACPAGVSGSVCTKYSTDLSYSCATKLVTSTCTNGTWSPTPGAYSTCSWGLYGCTNPAATNYNSGATVDNGTCVFPVVTYGCTDPGATNYNPSATQNDGSCQYPQHGGCTDPNATNYDPSAAWDDGSCQY